MLTTRKTALAAIVASLMLSACGGSSSNDNNDNSGGDNGGSGNAAPTAISLDANSVEENIAGAEIGTLTVTDEDDDSHTFSVDDERFVVTGNTLMLAEGQALNFEKAATVTLNVTATDSGDESVTEEFSIDVTDVLDTYSFTSAFTEESSVSYSGQIARYVLLTDIKTLMDTEFGAVEDFNNAGYVDRQDALDALLQYFDNFGDQYDAIWGATNIRISTDPAKDQQTLLEVSGSNKNLVGKLAGNDATGQHKDWSTEFVGWGAAGSTDPESLVRSWFNELADNAESQLAGNQRLDPFGDVINKVHLTDDGLNLSQLIHKFLLMGVAYSQSVDDYLDDDTEGKGLMTDNTSQDDGAAFTTLEHQFDEGYGYFGAARDFLDYSDEMIASPGYMDTDESGSIDLESEFNFTFAGYAAKRDLGSQEGVKTDFTQSIFDAFLQGRKIINDNAGQALTTAQMDDLKVQRDIIVSEWEKVVAANVIHYANSTLSDYENINTEDFDYGALATHWSELKAFALGLQFNRFKAISDEDFASLHQLIGDKPVLTGDMDAYLADIEAARDLVGTAYGFADANVQNW
ncbi:hypothetical protein HMF8227_01868 [Saliniradius amylolyticus]|uniref:Cadherin domain-containing protein n=1 Tax=Saliniradius amylolyticus TaxID=2183582 RepID=A0A2S2E3V7_9ALTE|nr:DUF4856 domain-containing protein [Saliniradius amylolyticus]AWL12338.1 hypothetical protein HMF8227_01868 [Saliniradius amylolyticus]